VTLEELLKQAKECVENSYSPYSHFRVGAALETETGEIFLGINVENRSFGLTNCAERTALFSAITEGHRKFRSLSVYAPDGDSPTSPCGACRQVLSEFTSPDFPVIYGSSLTNYVKTTMGELFPQDGLQDFKNK
jgi:cytidine deaminase